MQIDSISLTVPASPLPPTQVSSANQEKEQAYKNLCQQYEAEAVIVIVVRVEDNQVGEEVYIEPEKVWLSRNNKDRILLTGIGTGTSFVNWLSVGSQTIPVAIFKSKTGFYFRTGAYMIWISKKPPRRISVIDKKVTFVDLSIGVPEHPHSIPAKKPDDGVGVKNLSQTYDSSPAPNVSGFINGQNQASVFVSPNAASIEEIAKKAQAKEDEATGLFIGFMAFHVIISPILVAVLFQSGWVWIGTLLGQLVLTLLFYGFSMENKWHLGVASFSISLPSNITWSIAAWMICTNFHVLWLAIALILIGWLLNFGLVYAALEDIRKS
jgi:hypothetical protein